MKKAKYACGELVYSYQNKMIAYPISRVEFRPYDRDKGPHELDNYAYKIALLDGSSKWINEESLSTTPIITYPKN
jgi:hypothetical protein